MIKMLKTLLGFVLVLSLHANAIEIGSDAKPIFARNIDGSVFSLSKLGPKPKVINFFWVECQPCKKEIPLLAKKQQQYKNTEFVFVHAEVNPKTGENYSVEQIKAFIDKLGVSPKNVILGTPLLKKSYAVKGFPATVLLSSDNKVEAYLEGFNSKTVEKLNKWLKSQ